jgi:hypothetical protein
LNLKNKKAKDKSVPKRQREIANKIVAITDKERSIT